jgi:antitoxin component YwqK of YwqJK toxin-antitoxin module
MFKFVPFTLFLVIPILSFSQQKSEAYYDYSWRETVAADHARFFSYAVHTDSGWYRNVFYINTKKLQMAGLFEDKDCKISNGNIYYLYPNGKFQSIGRYIHNKKEGCWQDYYSDGSLKDSMNYRNGELLGVSMGWYRNGMPIDSFNLDAQGNGIQASWFNNGQPSAAGRFVDHKKEGRWQYYHKTGQLSAIDIYLKDSLISRQYFDVSGTSSTASEDADKIAVFPGGEKAWSKYLSGVLYWPNNLDLANSEFGVVVISGIIDEEGNIKDAEVTVPFHPRFDEIALNAIKKSPRWIPAMDHNRKVQYQFTEAISFSQGFR